MKRAVVTPTWRGRKNAPKRKIRKKQKLAQTDVAPLYQEISRLDPEEAVKSLKSFTQGLDLEQVRERLSHFGFNTIGHEEESSWRSQLLKAFLNPFIVLLTVLAVVSYFTDDLPGAFVMGTMVFVSVFLTFVQEFRSTKAAEKLKALVSNKVSVMRRLGTYQVSDSLQSFSKKIEIPIIELVPGDIVFLSAGDMIPGDLRVLASKDLFVSQSALTGESIPIEKFSDKEKDGQKELLDLRNICFMGSNVVSGSATAIAVRTGAYSYLGSIAKSIVGQRVQTSFDKGIQRFTWLMLRFMVVMVPLVFLINGLTKHNWLEALMFAVAVAVGLTPEMLPMIVTVNLAKGAMAMSKKKVIVKRLNSIQNFGAMDTLCTDKTGTLTQDNVILLKSVDPLGNKDDGVIKFAYLNSNYQTGLKNLLDVAVIKHLDQEQVRNIARDFRKIDEIPFDFVRRRMSVIVEERGKKNLLICKGALEEIFNASSFAMSQAGPISLTQEIKENCLRVARDLNEDGLRVIGVAVKEETQVQSERHYSVKDESELTLLGFLAFLDPPKETSRQAIEALQKRGVIVKVLTGDNDIVTRKICSEVGLDVEKILLGQEVEKMSDEELAEAAQNVVVFAKLTPAQKERIIRAMHAKGRVVGFMGDGINDAAALRAADVGISVDNAVDIAKESADIILLEKNLLVLEEGVVEGRKVFGNIVKYIKMGASSNFGNVFSVLGASTILPFLPMAPVQLLTQNLLYDLSQTAIPFDEVDEEYLEKPRKWEIGDIAKFMGFIGPISSIFDYITFYVMWHFFKAQTAASASLFQSGWFIEGLLSQTLIVHMIRTRKIPFIQSRASAPLLFMTALIMVIGIYIPYSGLGSKIGLSPLPMEYFFWLGGILICYSVLTQFVKTWFISRYGYN